ncbi:MAG: DNA methylase [Candidatus Hydrogenedentes bacterium]|nr:DNA methylase [Candidatus Hydrogenedentota bacterium]
MAPKPELMTTTLWDFPSQQYGDESQGDKNYRGATPAYILWNLLQRYTKPKDLVVDPMAGSGTTLDVARELGRRALGYDLQPTRPDIFHCDARKLPLEDGKASFVFVDPPYSTHLEYSNDPRCIGKLHAGGPDYYIAMERVIAEIHRILKPGRFMALYVSDSFEKEKPFCPIGFELFSRLSGLFTPVDIICVTRRNRTLQRNHWHTSAIEGNYFLRGFNYLFVMRKETSIIQETRSLPHSMNIPPQKNYPAQADAKKSKPFVSDAIKSKSPSSRQNKRLHAPRRKPQ